MPESVAFPQDRSCPFHPPTAYQPLTEQRPLSRVTLFDGREVWVVTGQETARQLLVDQRLSSNRRNPSFPAPNARFEGTRHLRSALIGVDDPEHNTQRRMLIPSFSLKRMTALRPRIQETVDQLLDRMTEQGPPAELVESFALPVPSMVICHLLGVPYADHEFFEAQSRRLLRGPRAEDSLAAREQLDAYFRSLTDRKLKEPGDGLFDDLVQQLQNGKTDREELASLGIILLVAGHETTANMISLGTYTLLQHPEQLAELTSTDTLVPAAVEELLRYLSIKGKTSAFIWLGAGG